MIKQTLKTNLGLLKGAWAKELPKVLWSYRTTTWTSLGETPFWLTYGCEAMIPVEFRVESFRREVFDEENNDRLMHLRLDLIEEYRKKAQLIVAVY